MSRLLSIAGAVDTISAAPAPVLFIDTCALLDAIRAPQRQEIPNTVMEATGLLHQMAIAHPPQIWVIVAPLVSKEWDDHSAKTLDALDIHIKLVDKHIESLSEAIRVTLPGTPSPRLPFAPLLLAAKLLQQAEGLLDSAIRLEEDQDCIMQARARIAQDTPPAAKGKSEFKDCEIIEHYLALCQQLQACGFGYNKVFVSSNKTDYCDGLKTSKLRAPLDTQFGAVNLLYAGDFSWAKGLL